MGLNSAPQGTFGGGAYRVGRDLTPGETKIFEKVPPRCLVDELPVRMRGQLAAWPHRRRARPPTGQPRRRCS